MEAAASVRSPPALRLALFCELCPLCLGLTDAVVPLLSDNVVEGAYRLGAHEAALGPLGVQRGGARSGAESEHGTRAMAKGGAVMSKCCSMAGEGKRGWSILHRGSIRCDKPSPSARYVTDTVYRQSNDGAVT